MLRRAVIAMMFLFLANSSFAETRIQSAPEVAAALESGDLVLLDIRTPEEWKETGLAKGAWPVSMHRPDFSKNLQMILAKYKPEQVAIICATGGRTSYVADVLAQNGIKGVVDLSEGMHGNKNGPGWIARGLPISSLPDAQSAFDQSFGAAN